MKRIMTLIAFGMFALNSCQEEEAVPAVEEVQFSIPIVSDDMSDVTDAIALPQAVIAQVSFEPSMGAANVNNQNIKFIRTGTNYISDPITLQNGDYTITHIDIQHDEIETLPGSHFNFRVSAKDPRLIQISSKAVRAKGSPMHITVYLEAEGVKTPTEATAHIYNETGESYEYILSAKKNNIAFKGDPQASYAIEIQKAGYQSYARTFVYNQLEKKRLEVTLQKITEPEPVLAVTFQPDADFFMMWIEVMGKGTMTLDWGNGETELLEFENLQATFIYLSDFYLKPQ
jgi:hypothetical protein